jgi:hypothetical protein
MEPAPREKGMYWVKDDELWPKNQAESTNIHLHLIHQGTFTSH